MIDRFLDYLLSEKKYSTHTVTSYRRDLTDFKNFYENNIQKKDILKAEKNDLRKFIMFLSNKGLTKKSINRKISSLKSFYLFLQRIGDIQHSPAETIKTLKLYTKKQTPFSEEEMELVAEQVTEDEIPKIIVETLYQTGMRRAEFCNLLIESVDFYNMLIKVEGKGKKQRVIPISEDLANLLERYISHIRPLSEEPYFFVSKNGKKISEKFVYTKVKAYLSTVSSKEKRSPHILRHSFATHLLNNGAEISKVKSLLGHSSLASTQVYTHANIEQLKKVLNKTHPRSEKEK